MNKRKKNTIKCLLAVMLAALFCATSAVQSLIFADTGRPVAVHQTGEIKSMSSEFALHGEEDTSVLNAEDDCWVIVKLDEEGVLDTALEKSPRNVSSYFKTAEAEKLADRMVSRQNTFLRRNKGIVEETGYRYTAIFNGVSIRTKYKNVRKLEKDSSVSSVIVSEKYDAPKAVTSNEVNVYPTGIYNSSEVGYDGSGTVVAILDTGLDYTHSAFQNLPQGNLALEKDRVTSLLSSLTATELSAEKKAVLSSDDLYLSDKVPYAYDYADHDAEVYPVNNHGTHVAGIIGGKDEVITGVATQAQLAIFKVFSNYEQGAGSDAILAALNDCVVLGVDAINMSLGSSCGFSRESDEDATNAIYDKIKETGICLIAAASNDASSSMQSTNGDTNLTTNPDSGTVGSPASYPASMAVASISGVKTKYVLANGEREIYYTESSTGNSNIKNDFTAQMLAGESRKQFEYVVVKGLGEESNFLNTDVRGKIAIIKRGSNTFEEKIKNAARYGAVGVIIYNNISGNISMSSGNATIPSCSITMDLGEYFIGKNTGVMTLSKDYLAGPFMSDFSSWGVLPDLELKPDITAHGGEIYSAVRDGYDIYSGTSMAAPNMAGATILVREYVKENYPDLTPYEVTELTYQLIMSTATIANNQEGNPYSPRKQGAGIADIGKSVRTGAYLYVEGENKTKLSLGDDPEKTGIYTLNFNIKNIGGSAVSYRINPLVMTESLSSDKKTVAEKAYMLSDCKFEYSILGSGATLAGDTVNLLGYESASLSIKITLSEAAKAYLADTFRNGMYVEGYASFESLNDDGIDLGIPFLGFYGDWSVAPLLDTTAFEVGKQKEDSSILEEDKLKEDVYATLPMSGFRYSTSSTTYEETYYGMGQFGYKVAEGYTEPAIREEKASLSCNIDGSYSLKIIAAGLLRNAKKTNMEIVDSVTGEVIWRDQYLNARKSYYEGGRRPGAIKVDFYANERNLPNNAKYTFNMNCELDWASSENNLNNSFSFDFYIDNEAPVLVKEQTQVRVERNSDGTKRYILDLNVYDNHYIQGYMIGTFSSVAEDGTLNDKLPFHRYIIPYEGKRNDVNKISYDITNYWEEIRANGDHIYFEAIDYAKNSAAYELKLPDSEPTDISFKRGVTNLNLKVNGTLDASESLVLTPTNLWTQSLVWSVKDPSVAMVENGIVTGLKAGTTELTVTNRDGTLSATVNLKIQPATTEEIKLTGIDLNKTSVLLERGESVTLTATLLPYNLTQDIKVKWSNGNQDFRIEVDKNDPLKATVTALFGNRNMTVQVEAEGSYINARCSIKVKEEFEVEGNYLKSYSGRGDENGVVTIPSDKNIKMIYNMAFVNNKYIKKIILPEGIEEIMEAGIYGCDSLEEVVLPTTCKTLDKWAFGWNPSLKKINLEHVRTIDELCFYGAKALDGIDLSNVSLIGPRAFAFCESITSVDLTNCKSMDQMAFVFCTSLRSIKTGELTSIGAYGFYQCTSLQEVELNGPNVGTFGFAFCSGLTRVTFNNPVDTIGIGAFYYCTSLYEANYRSTVRVIDALAYMNCNFKRVYLPNGLEKLGEQAFSFDDIYQSFYGGTSEVIIASGARLSEIGSSPFHACKNLQNFTVEAGNAYLSSNDGILFDKGMKKVLLCPYGKAISEIILPDSVVEIGSYAFANTSAAKKVTANHVRVIGDGAFLGSGVSAVSFSDDLVRIGTGAFASSKIAKFTFPDSVEYIGERAFQKTTALNGEIRLPANLTYLGAYAFSGDSLVTSVVVNDKLREIESFTFTQCTALKTVDFANVERLGEYVFAYCSALKTLDLPDTIVDVGFGTFGYCTSLESIVLSPNMASVADYLLVGCKKLTEIVLPDSVKSIGEGAFYETSVTEINLEQIEYIGNVAFANTTMTEIDAPNVVEVGLQAFFKATDLTTVRMPKVVTIGKQAFVGCTDLKTAVIPNAKYIGEGAFMSCRSLNKIDLENVEYVGALAFGECAQLTSVTFNRLEELSEQAFYISGLTSIRLPATMKNFHPGAFYAAPKLDSIAVDASNPLYFAKENVLYRRMPNGRFTLVAYPAGKTDATEGAAEGGLTVVYEVDANTVRIEAFAFADNNYVEKVVLPERLEVIGSSAFYSCAKLSKVEFLCSAAPVLESRYDKDLGVDVSGRKNLNYSNFQNANGDALPELTIVCPKNGTGYDSFLWARFFDGRKIVSENISRTRTTIELIDTLEALDADETTLGDLNNLIVLRRIYNSLDTAQKGFIETSLVTNKLVAAEAKIGAFVSEKINELPGEIALTDKSTVEDVRALYNSLTAEMKSHVKNLSKLTAAETRLEELSSGGDDDDNDDKPDEKGCGTMGIDGGWGGILLLACCASALLIAIRRRSGGAE